MPAMKLTPNAAMRARDVSRPRAEHLAEAEEAEASAAAGSRSRTGDAAKQARGGDKAKTPHPPSHSRRRSRRRTRATSGRDGPGSRDAGEAAGRAEDRVGPEVDLGRDLLCWSWAEFRRRDGHPVTSNLTRDEAATRSALITVSSYQVDLDLTGDEKTFGSVSVIRFGCAAPGSSTLST